jgi:large subunit ribosomal protein L17
MSHRRVGRKLGVVTKHRISMFRNMVTDLLRHESIKTTDTRAKELKRFAEKMITLAKKGTLHSRRQAAAFIRDRAVLKKLFDEIAQKYKDRPGGYTRIIKFGFRKGDNAPVSIIELVEEEIRSKGKKKTKKSKLKEPLPATAASDARSSKKEAAEELGLIEKKKETGVEVAKAEAEPETIERDVEEPAAKVEKKAEDTSSDETEISEDEAAKVTEQATESNADIEPPETQVEQIWKTPAAKVEESTEELEAKKAESNEASLESTESQTEEVQTPEAKVEESAHKDDGSSEDSSEVEPEETKKDT